MATLRILSAVYDFNSNPSVGNAAGVSPRRRPGPQKGPSTGLEHSTIASRIRMLAATLAILSAFWTLGCRSVGPTKLDSAYAAGAIRLEILPDKRFRLNFDPATPWSQFGPLEGEVTQYAAFVALLPKTLGGKTEEEITSQAFQDAQQLGKQTDLMAVRVLMTTVKLDVSGDSKRLTVTQPPPKDPDEHPLSGAVLAASP
jgi:hypothetical protein